MLEYIFLGTVDGDWCRDVLMPPHMPWWLGQMIGKALGCWGHESMMPLLLVVIAFAVWHVTVARKHLRKES